MQEPADEELESRGEPNRPPGHFMDEQLAHDTARFLAEVKRLAERRSGEQDEPETWEPPR